MRNTLTVIKPKEQPSTSELINPVSSLWSVELLYGKHPNFSEKTYAVRLTTKLIGGAARCYLVLDLDDNIDAYVRELNVFGHITRADYYRLLSYVHDLKINGVFTQVENLLDYINGITDQDEGNAYYDIVADAVCSDIERFPTISSDSYVHGESPGVRMDTEFYHAKYDTPIAVSSEYLYDVFQLEGTNKGNRLLEIARSWRDANLLQVKNKTGRLQEEVKPNPNSKVVKRLYIFSLKALFTNQGMSMPEFADADASENS